MNEFYEYIESTVNTLGTILLPEKIKEIANSTGVSEKRFNWESIALRFNLVKGKTLSYSSGTRVNEQGETEIIEFPNHSLFSKSSYEYFESRLMSVNNKFLRIRYAQILFNSRLDFTHIKQAEIIIESSLELITQLKSSKEYDQRSEIFHLINNAICISVKVKGYRIEELKKILLFEISEESRFFLPIQELLEVVYNLRKKLGAAFINEVLKKSNEIVDNLVDDANSIIGPTLIETVMKLAVVSGIDKKEYYAKIGMLYEKHATSDKPSGEMARVIALTYAYENFTKSGDYESIQRVGLKYEEVKNKVNLDRVRLNVNDDHKKYLQAIVTNTLDSLENANSDQILKFLSDSPILLPKLDNSESNLRMGFMDFATNAIFDTNSNVKVTQGLSKRDKYFHAYEIEFKLFYSEFINAVFVENIKNGKLTAKSIISFFKRHSWLGQVIEMTNKNQDIIRYSWLNEFGNTVLEFFSQLEASTKIENYPGNYVMCIDSLVLKFEPIIRDIVKYFKLSSTKVKDGIVHEVFLEELVGMLERESIISKQNSDFFLFLYTSVGHNLRNNIAHGFVKSHFQSYFHYLLVLFSILRISRFKINANEEE